jgi:hypothetical protein
MRLIFWNLRFGVKKNNNNGPNICFDFIDCCGIICEQKERVYGSGDKNN